MKGETNLSVLIKNMHPILNKGEYVFCSLPHNTVLNFDKILFYFKEKEGLTIVIEKSYADKQGYTYSSTFAWITLQVHSALEAVGLTAAFSQALANNNISCNVVAGFYHDHIFVQYPLAQQAVDVLKKLAKSQ
jgi:uncharacterized protein